MVLLRLVHPEDVVEQQLGCVTRREALVREPRPAHHHRAQLADFAVDSELLHFRCLLYSGSALRRKNAAASASGSPNHFAYAARNSGAA